MKHSTSFIHITAINRLFESGETKGMKLGLSNMVTLDHALGSPSTSFAKVHVAGTNGKGSVSTKIARVLQASGKKVGLYTSPHIHTFHERIEIDGITICDEEAERLLNRIFLAADRENLKPTFFEIMTLLAFLFFAERKVEIAVLEVGLGGRLDATNIVTPLLSVITSIDFDHEHFIL